MSFTKNDRKIRSIDGKEFPSPGNSAPTSGYFAGVIAEALHRGFGDARSAVKTVAALTGANERAVRNWFDGRNGPSGEHLVELVKHSDEVLEALLAMCSRNELIAAHRIIDTRRELKEMIGQLDEYFGGSVPGNP